MLKVSKVGVLFAVLAFSGLLASSASAATWHTNGVATWSSTNAGASRLIIHPAGGGTIVRLECPTSSGSVTVNGPTSATLPWLSAATVTPVFGAVGNCTVNDIPGYTVVCSSAELRANSYAGGNTLASAGGGVTSGAVTGVDCRLSAGASTCSTITGSVNGDYINPSPIATGAGQLTVTTAGQSLTVAKIGSGCAAVPHGQGTFGSPSGASGITHLTYTVDGPNAPYIYRSL